jgi:hypothetical protein
LGAERQERVEACDALDLYRRDAPVARCDRLDRVLRYHPFGVLNRKQDVQQPGAIMSEFRANPGDIGPRRHWPWRDGDVISRVVWHGVSPCRIMPWRCPGRD